LVPAGPAWARALEVSPAWDGHFAQGRSTEIGVRLLAPVGGEARIRIEGEQGDLEYRATLEANRPFLATLPASPGPGGRLSLRATLPDAALLEKEVRFLAHRDALPVRILGPGSREAGAGRAGSENLLFTADSLPRSAAGYGSVRSLELPADGLALLDTEQAGALADYLAACGALRLPGASAGVLRRVRSAAGCSGRFVTASEPAGAPSGDAGPGDDPPPGDGFLAGLLEASQGGGQVRDILLLMLPYAVLLLALAGSRRLGAWLLLIPPGAALAYALVLPLGAGGASAVTWARMDAGDSDYRYAKLVELRGSGGGQPPLSLPAGPWVLASADSGPVSRRIDARTGTTEIGFPGALLQHRRYRLEGTARSPISVRLEPADGAVRLINRGTGPIPAGWLRRDGETFQTPALSAGSMTTLKDVGPGSGLPAPWPAASSADPFLLVPFAAPGTADPRLTGAGWLLIRMARSDP
jgi:hypothetical protein